MAKQIQPKQTVQHLGREQALELQKKVSLSSFFEQGKEWRMFYAHDLKAGYYGEDGKKEEREFGHPLEASQYFNQIRSQWIQEHNIR